MINSSTSSRGVFKFAASAMAVGLVVLAGCSMESSEEDMEGEEGVSVVESTSSALSVGCGTAAFAPSCPVAADGKKSHAEATKIMRYIFGDDSVELTRGPGAAEWICQDAMELPLKIRQRIAAGTVSIQRTSGTVCGRPSVIYTLRPTNGVQIAKNNDLNSYAGKLYSCNLWSGTGAFSLVDAVNLSGSSCTAAEFNQHSYVRLDPEAVTLTANLTSSTSGATAAAVGVDTGASTTAIRWGSSYTSCGSYGAHAGSPCTTTAAYSGNTLDRRLVKKGTLCACL